MAVPISLITINYNNKAGLSKTIESVLNQKYSQVEYIIIDGGSNDGSTKIIVENQDKVSYWVSEPDRGVYHAMNKGIAKATGDYVLFLNSGDYLCDENVLVDCLCKFVFDEDIIYGDLNIEQNGGLKYRKKYPDKLSFSFFLNHESLPHPATFIKRELFERVGYYNEKFRIVSDWEFWVKAIFLHAASYKRLPVVISTFNLEGISSNPKNSQLSKMEKQVVLNRYFPHLLEDFKEYHALKASIEASKVIKFLRKAGIIKI